MAADTKPITWAGDYPVVRNKTVAISLLAVSTISAGLAGMLLIGIAVQDGNYDFVGTLLKIVGGIWLGFTALLFLIGIVFFGGKVPVEVMIDDRGVVQAMLSKRARAANLLLICGGLAGGRAVGATAAGAGILAEGRRLEGFRYRDLCSAKGDARTGEIRLWDEWHTVMQIFVPLDRYDEALTRIETGIAKARPRRNPRTDIPTATKALTILGAILLGAFLLVDFPLAFSFVFVLPMVSLTIVTVLSRPIHRRWFGWILAAGVVVSAITLLLVSPPALGEPGSGLVLGIQMTAIGIFAVFGACVGLGLFSLKSPAIQP